MAMTGTTSVSNGRREIGMQAFLQVMMPGAVVLYCMAFQGMYVWWIAPVWGYSGATYDAPDSSLLAVAYLLAVTVSLLSPQKIWRPSQVIYWFLYFIVYIPGMLAPLFMQLDSSWKLLLLELSLSGGMTLVSLSYRLRIMNVRRYPMNRQLFWSLFFAVFVLMNALLIYVFRGSLHFASFEEVYDIRAQAAAVQQGAAGVSYISGWLANVMNPFLVAYGLASKRRKLVVFGVIGQVIVYSTAAMKSVLLSPVFIFVIYFSMKKGRVGWVSKFAIASCAMFVVFTWLAIGKQEGIFFSLASLILYRTFAIPGVEIGEYQYFFENSPHTFFGQVHGLSLLVGNPYKLSLGFEVGSYYLGVASNGRIADANVSFFASDGIASIGMPGILVMGIVCALAFWLLDSTAKNYPITFTASVLTSCAMSLTNASLFTSLLGGGIMLFMVLFIVMPRDAFRPDSAVGSAVN
jgi:hypothetical protein